MNNNVITSAVCLLPEAIFNLMTDQTEVMTKEAVLRGSVYLVIWGTIEWMGGLRVIFNSLVQRSSRHLEGEDKLECSLCHLTLQWLSTLCIQIHSFWWWSEPYSLCRGSSMKHNQVRGSPRLFSLGLECLVEHDWVVGQENNNDDQDNCQDSQVGSQSWVWTCLFFCIISSHSSWSITPLNHNHEEDL